MGAIHGPLLGVYFVPIEDISDPLTPRLYFTVIYFAILGNLTLTIVSGKDKAHPCTIIFLCNSIDNSCDNSCENEKWNMIALYFLHRKLLNDAKICQMSA